MNITGNRLQELRNKKGITQEKVAEDLNLDPRRWKSYEYGTRNMPLKILVSIAKYFNVSSDYLLGLDEEMKPGAKEFQLSTGLAESAITNISKYKDFKPIMDCINTFLSSDEFDNAMQNTVIAKTPIMPKLKKTDELIEIGVQASKLYSIIAGKKGLNDAKVILTGTRLQEWELLLAKQNLTNLVDRIVKGEQEDGKR